MLRRKLEREPLFYFVWGYGLRCGKVDKIVNKFWSCSGLVRVARGGYSHFDSGAFLPDSSLGI